MGKITNDRWLKVCTLLLVALLPLFLGGCGGSQNEPTWNITSSSTSIWYTTSGTPGELGPYIFTFTQSGNTLTGETSQTQGLTGTVNGSNVTFTFPWVGVDLNSYTYTYNGTINGNGTMDGTWTNTNNQTGTWRSLRN